MNYTIDEILDTPTAIIEEMMTSMDTELTGGTVTREYTSPFHMLLEKSRFLSKDSLLATQSIIRRKFSSLAVASEDIYLHIHNDVKDNLFAIPGTAPFIFYVNVIDLKQYSVKVNDSYRMTLPAETTVVVRGVTFTLLNDIDISLKKNGSITVEQVNNDLDIAVNDIGILPSALYTDTEGVSWIMFETSIKNVTKTSTSLPIVVPRDFNKVLPLTNKYSAIDVTCNTGSKLIKLNISYSDQYIDETMYTAIISLSDNEVTVTIPDLYLVNPEFTGRLLIDMYETNGKLYLPLNQLTTEDFIITINKSGTNEYTAVSPNITMFATSRSVLSNGVDNMSFSELKTAVINSTLGDIDLPITDLQIKRKGSMLGYEMANVKDTLFSRLYIANKSLPDTESDLITAKPDIYFNKTTVDLASDQHNNFVELYNDIFIIKNNAIFKYDGNGKTMLLSNIEYEAFNNLSKINKIEYLKSNKLFFTPFTYVVKYSENVTYTEVYYLKPSIDNIRILNKNFNVLPKVNTKQYDLSKNETGYVLKTNLATNDELLKTDLTMLRARAVFPIAGSNSTLYFDANYDVTTGMFVFNIETGYLYDNVITLDKSTSVLTDKAVNLSTVCTMYIYTLDANIVDSERFLMTEFGRQDFSNLTILTKEKIDITFGKRLDYLYNSIYTVYNTRKYKKYTANVPAVYTEDKYELTSDGLIFTSEITPSGKVEMSGNKIHSKGDPILDSHGNPIYKYQIGNNILDDNGDPIIDLLGGIKRLINIMMLEYEFAIAETETYKAYMNMVMDLVMSMTYDDMVSLNALTLENTIIKYKSYRSVEDVPITVNNVTYLKNYSTSPLITLFVTLNNNIVSTETLENYKSICGKILTAHLNKNIIVLRDIKNAIISALGTDITAVGITKLDSNNSEVLTLADNKRFIINKKLELNETNLFTVKYDIDLKIEYV